MKLKPALVTCYIFSASLGQNTSIALPVPLAHRAGALAKYDIYPIAEYSGLAEIMFRAVL